MMEDIDVKQLDKDGQTELLTDVQIEIYKRYFRKKARTYRTFSEGMLRVVALMEGQLQKLQASRRDKMPATTYAKLEKQYTEIRDHDKKIADDALHDAEMFSQMADALERTSASARSSSQPLNKK